ncbi:MAG: hypothetical protein AAGG51_28050 [Cyanobacteria bacterium P01_G01_bin.54]
MQQRSWLNRLEYVTIAASAVGIVTTALTQQLFWVLTPLLVTWGLGTAQRRQLQARYTQLAEQLAAQSTAADPTPSLAKANAQGITQLSQQIETQEQRLAQQAALAEDLEQMRSQLASLPELTAATTHLQQQWTTLQIPQLPQTLDALQTTVQELQVALAEQATAATQTPWRLALQALEERLGQLEQQQQGAQPPLPEATMSDSVVAEIARLQEQVQRLHKQLAAVTANTVAANSETATLPEPTAPSNSVQPETDDEARSSATAPKAPSTANAQTTLEPDATTPPTVPPQYRREHLEGPEPPINPGTEATTAKTDVGDEPGENTPAQEPPEASPPQPDLENRLPPELEAGVKELGENLWAMGKSLRQTWDRFAQGLEAEATAAQADWQQSLTYPLPDFMPQAVAISAAGQYVAYVSRQGMVRVVDWRAGETLAQIQPETAGVTALALSPDAQSLLVGQSNGQASLWYWSSGEHRHTLIAHPLPVLAVAISPHGRTGATGSADKTIALWDLATGQLLRSLVGHWEPVLSLAFSPEGKSLLSGSADGTIKRWDVEQGHKVANATPGSPVQTLAVSPDGQWVVSGGDRQAHCWTLNTLAQKAQHRLLRKVTTVATAPEPPLWGAIAGSSLQLWQGATVEKTATLALGQSAIALQWRPQVQALLCITETGIVQLWQQS